jgi:hypothetical protein
MILWNLLFSLFTISSGANLRGSYHSSYEIQSINHSNHSSYQCPIETSWKSSLLDYQEIPSYSITTHSNSNLNSNSPKMSSQELKELTIYQSTRNTPILFSNTITHSIPEYIILFKISHTLIFNQVDTFSSLPEYTFPENLYQKYPKFYIFTSSET